MLAVLHGLFYAKFSFGAQNSVRLVTPRFINVHFIEILLLAFDCKSISAGNYYPSVGGIYFIGCVLHVDFTVSYNFGKISKRTIAY